MRQAERARWCSSADAHVSSPLEADEQLRRDARHLALTHTAMDTQGAIRVSHESRLRARAQSAPAPLFEHSPASALTPTTCLRDWAPQVPAQVRQQRRQRRQQEQQRPRMQSTAVGAAVAGRGPDGRSKCRRPDSASPAAELCTARGNTTKEEFVRPSLAVRLLAPRALVSYHSFAGLTVWQRLVRTALR